MKKLLTLILAAVLTVGCVLSIASCSLFGTDDEDDGIIGHTYVYEKDGIKHTVEFKNNGVEGQNYFWYVAKDSEGRTKGNGTENYKIEGSEISFWGTVNGVETNMGTYSFEKSRLSVTINGRRFDRQD